MFKWMNSSDTKGTSDENIKDQESLGWASSTFGCFTARQDLH